MRKVFSLALAIFFVGCGATAAYKTPSAPVQETERVVLLNRVHKPYLKTVKSKIEKLPAGQMEVLLEMENRKNQDIPTDIQVIFRGADGFEVEKTSWTPFTFHRREVTTFRQSAMNPNAVDYRIIIRKPQ